MLNKDMIKLGVRHILKGLNVDPGDHNFLQTPDRVADVYEEMFTPPDTGYPVFDEKYTDMIIMRGHTFYTMCPHHLLPVKIKAAVGYIPNGKVIGASKLMRMMHDANRFPMTQEALTAAIHAKIQELTLHTSLGEAIFLEGWHGCFEIRGTKSHGTSLVTVKFGGAFEDTEKQRRFLDLVRW